MLPFSKFLNRTALNLATLVLVPGFLAGCGSNNGFQDLQDYVAEVLARPGEEVEPVPEFESYEAFTYGAVSLRSPFEIPLAILQSADGLNAGNVQPDNDRVREPLEEFGLAELTMVGMIERNGRYQALIRDITGAVSPVAVGNYVGKNHGRIVLISPSQIDIVEIVPSGDGGWIERPQLLTLAQ